MLMLGRHIPAMQSLWLPKQCRFAANQTQDVSTVMQAYSESIRKLVIQDPMAVASG